MLWRLEILATMTTVAGGSGVMELAKATTEVAAELGEIGAATAI